MKQKLENLNAYSNLDICMTSNIHQPELIFCNQHLILLATWLRVINNRIF